MGGAARPPFATRCMPGASLCFGGARQRGTRPPTWRVFRGLSKQVVSRLISTLKGTPTWGYGTYKSLK